MAVFRYPSRICRVWPSVFGIVYSFHPFRLDKSNSAKQKLCHGSNVICDGSPSRIRSVRRISFGITILPRSSTRRTIPVAFINLSLLALRLHCYCLQVLGNYAICPGIGNAVFCQAQKIHAPVRTRRQITTQFLCPCRNQHGGTAPISAFACPAGFSPGLQEVPLWPPPLAGCPEQVQAFQKTSISDHPKDRILADILAIDLGRVYLPWRSVPK